MANKEQEHVDDWQGNAELLHPSEYIRAADIEDAGKPVTLTIDRVEKNAKLTMAGGKVDLKPVVHFAETNRKLVLNKTNTKRVMELHGKKVADWKGKKITLITEPWRGAELAVRVKVGK
jgi:hypothetical protein